MTIAERFVSRDARRAGVLANAARKGVRALFVDCSRTAATALLGLSLFLTVVPAWAQSVALAGANVAPLEGPGAGTDTVLVYASGLQGTATVTVTTGADWITIVSTVAGSNTMIMQNGPNRVRFQFAANTDVTRTGEIVLVALAGGQSMKITVTQAGAGFQPAGLVPIITAVSGPKGIDVDSQGNLYIAEVTGTGLFQWTASTQNLTAIASGPSNSFVDVAVDGAGDVFALENTPDGNLGTQVEQVRATQGQSLPPGNIVFSSETNNFLFPMGLCVDSAGKNLNVTAISVGVKCLIDQFGTVYELDSIDTNQNIGSFTSPPTNANYMNPPTGAPLFPYGSYVDPCGNTLSGVSGSLYGLSKDGSGFIYFVDQNGTRLNRYDPAAPGYTCTPPPNSSLNDNNTTDLFLNFGNFTTVANLTFPAFYTAADVMGNIYLSEMPFSRIEELPRAYVYPGGLFNEPVGGGTGEIQVLPETQSLTNVFAPVSSNTSWLNVTSTEGGVVNFSVAPNAGPSRTGIITVLGVPIQVVQAESQIPAAMAIVSGNNQTAALGAPFATNLLVKVTNQWGDPAANAPIQFLSPSQQQYVTTDARGYAAVMGFTAYAAGPISVTASVLGTGLSQTFQLTGIQSGISVVSGSNQSAGIYGGVPFGNMEVLVIGANGQPVAGVPVTFSAPTSGASGTFELAPYSAPTSSMIINTDANGIAQTSPSVLFYPNLIVGAYQVTASVSVAGVSSSCVFNLTNYSFAVQTGATTRTFPAPIITQASKNAFAGTMTFTVVPGAGGAGGSFNGYNSVTVDLDSQGYGTSPLLTANSTPGTFLVTASDGLTVVGSTFTTTQCLNSPVAVTSPTDGALRNALNNACAGSNIDLTQVSGGNVIYLQGSLRLDDNMTITGPGSGQLAIDGGSSYRILFIGNGDVALSGLTLQNAIVQGGSSVFGGGGAGMGGAIFMENGNVKLTDVTFSGNRALGGGSGTSDPGGVCTANCTYGGGGFAGNAIYPEQGGSSGSLNGLAGLSDGASGDFGGGGAGTGVLSTSTNQNGGNGGFGAGGGTGQYLQGVETNSGNGGFGGGGAGGFNNASADNPVSWGIIQAGSGGYGAGNGYMPQSSPSAQPQPNFGGGGAGFGGAIFVYSGQLTLNGVRFFSNWAAGGPSVGINDQPTIYGQGKGGALFIYNGATVINNGSTFGTGGQANIAAQAGVPGNGNSAAPYTNGATCPGLDTVDVCGIFGNTTVTITVPSGVQFSINGVSYTGSQTLTLPQSQYTLAGPAPQATGAGTQTALSWSDGGALSHTITAGPGGLSITGVFATQYLLTISAGAGGLAVPASSGYYNAGSVVNLNALPNLGSLFTNWTGPVAAAGSAATTVTMNAPQTVMANFAGSQMVNVAVPLGVSFTLNGTTYTGSQFVSLAPGQYTLSTTSPQVSTTGDQELLFNSWSDGGGLSHTITVGSSALSISGSFSTQYQLIANAGTGGTISAASGFYASGTVVDLTATPNPGYAFHNWTGMVASPSSATTTVTISQGATVTANFWPAPSACVVAPANVTAWWKGDGSASDETSSFNATLGGDVSFAPGLVGQAFSFDGTQSPFVSVPEGAFFPQPGSGAFSFETWFQTSGGNGGIIIGQQGGAPYQPAPQGWSPSIYVGTDGNLHVQMFFNGSPNQIVGTAPVNDNQWHHVAVTYDGNSETVYLDGANIGETQPFAQVQYASPLFYQLGTGYAQSWPATNNGWYTFNGLIDEPTVYSRALTAAEVLSIAQAGGYGKCDPLAVLNPGTLNFASIAEGQTATQTAVLSNPGNAPLAISALAADAGDTTFTVLSGNAQDCAVGTPVQPNASCSVRVQFSPQGAGTITGQISITDNSVVGQGTQVISLVGSSQSQPPTVTFTGPSSAVYGSTFTPVVSTNSGAADSIVASGPCQINGTVVTMTAGVGLCQLQASWPANAPFAAATATLGVNATPAVVTATVTVANKTFDGTTAATVSSCTLDNVLSADAGSVTCTAANAAFSSPGVDNNIPVTVSGIALGGSAAANYQLSSTTATTTANIVFGSADSACIAPPAGVTAWWKADGNANDVTGAFGATLGGDVSFASGKVGQAFSFDGTQSPFVLLPAGAFPAEPSNAPFTFENWFQTTGGNGGVILGQQSGAPYETNVPGWTPAIYVGTDGKLYAQMFYSSSVGIAQVVSSIPVNDNAWHHVAVTYDGTNEVVYLDAGAIGTINGLVEAPNGSSLSYELGTGFTYGWPNGNNGWYTFNGLIDEATVYSRSLSAGEVANIVQAANYGKCNPGASVNPGTLTFNNTPPGNTATLSAALSNPGNAPLTISSIAVDSGDTNFSVLSDNAGDCAASTPVQPNASCNIRVQFAPQATGSPSGSVTVQGNSLYNAGVQTIQLTGTALQPQTISFGNIATQTAGTPLTLAATATSGLAVSFTSTTPGVCSVTGNTANFLTYGSCTITASQSGNGTYLAANPVSQTFVVMSPQTIVFPGIGSQMLGTPLILTATASSGLPVSYASSTTGVCSVSGNTVAFAAVGTCTIKASQAGNANYLPAAPVTQSFSVGKEAQSITWAAISTQTVQQTVALTASASSGLPITYASSSTAICTVSGSTASLIAGGTCTIKATQAGNGTYASQTASQSFTVNKLAQSITFGAIATPQAIGGQATLSVSSTSGLSIAIVPSPTTVCTVSGTIVSFVAAGTCKLTATQPGNSIYAAATAVSQSIVVTKIAQTISFGSIANQNAGSSLALTASASSGLSVTYTASPSSVCTVSGSNASFVGGGTCTIIAAQSGNATYSAAPSVSSSFMVDKLSQFISFPSISAQNVNATVTLAAIANSGLTVSYSAAPSSVCKVSGSIASMAGSGTCTITASQAGSNVYAAATAVPQSFLVSKLPQTISFGSIGSQTVDTSLTLTATASSGLAVSYIATPSNVCKVSGSTVTLPGSGTCAITASQAGNSIYAAATAVPISFAVTKVAQTITFGAIPTQTVGTPLTLTATASSGLTVTYTATPSKVCKVSGSTVTMSAAGTCNITAAQSGNAEYAVAPSVLESFQVVP